MSALLLGTSAGACTPSDTAPPVTIYVTVGFEDQVHVLDGRTGEPLETLPLNPRLGEVDEPHGVAVHSGTGHWYATVSHGTPTLWKFELQTDRLVGRLTLPLQGASRIGLSPDGSLGLIPDYFRGSLGDPTAVALVSLHDLEVLWTRDLCVAPHDAAFSPDGRSAALACALSDEVVLFTLDEPSQWRSVRLDEGSRPMNLAWADDGSRLFSTLMGADEVVAIDPAEGRAVGRIGTGGSPAQIARQPGGQLLAVANRTGGSVSLIDASTADPIRQIPISGSHPHGVAWQPDGQVVFVTWEGDTREPGGVLALDLQGNPIWERELGAYVLGVAAVATPPPVHPPGPPPQQSPKPQS